MRVQVNLDRFNESGLAKISERVSATGGSFGEYGPLLVIDLPSGSTLLAMPISSINPLAPPEIRIKGKPHHAETNKSGYRRIVNVLRPACKSKHLPEAVKMIKAAINAISR